jgi:FMN phosphatase YigB (HAD superfamily)
MLEAVLLDLDNTLILFDEPAFYDRFFQRMAPLFEDLMPSDELARRTIAATVSLKDNDGEMCNRDWFSRAFDRGDDLPLDLLWERWMHFYREIYHPFGVEVGIPPGQAATISRLQRRGLALAIASNPIFPPIALQRRMAWGEITPAPFSLLTHMDNMSFVKPNPGYYRAVASALGVLPEACLMVGNDPVNDMAAGSIGMTTYQTTDAQESHFASLTTGDTATNSTAGAFADYRGPLAGVVDIVDALMRR